MIFLIITLRKKYKILRTEVNFIELNPYYDIPSYQLAVINLISLKYAI